MIKKRFIEFTKPEDFDLNPEKEYVLDILENTNSNVFLGGRAGTGKSNFLKYFRATTKKNVVVLAFTGVAALNVNGQTIHSFFKFHPQTTINKIRRVKREDAEMYKEIDVIIIDEVSMLRADLMDFIDRFMRLNGRHPGKAFGGVQMLLIGDLLQLPPIVGEDEKDYFNSLYESPYFFSSSSYQSAEFIKKELQEVYRQDAKSQSRFIEALDNFRICEFNDSDIDLINSRFFPDFKNTQEEMIVSLVPTNFMANSINMKELEKISSEPAIFHGYINGDFKEKSLPNYQELVLKKNSQVILLNNDARGRWCNGDLAKLVEINASSIGVLLNNGEYQEVSPITWEAIKYTFDKNTRNLKAKVVGTFTQLPIKLAWALTVHKGQGKSFDKLHIDFGKGTFVFGQAYVALSRCRSLEGLFLSSALEKKHIFIDKKIKEFLTQDLANTKPQTFFA